MPYIIILQSCSMASIKMLNRPSWFWFWVKMARGKDLKSFERGLNVLSQKLQSQRLLSVPLFQKEQWLMWHLHLRWKTSNISCGRQQTFDHSDALAWVQKCDGGSNSFSSRQQCYLNSKFTILYGILFKQFHTYTFNYVILQEQDFHLQHTIFTAWQ